MVRPSVFHGYFQGHEDRLLRGNCERTFGKTIMLSKVSPEKCPDETVMVPSKLLYFGKSAIFLSKLWFDWQWGVSLLTKMLCFVKSVMLLSTLLTCWKKCHALSREIYVLVKNVIWLTRLCYTFVKSASFWSQALSDWQKCYVLSKVLCLGQNRYRTDYNVTFLSFGKDDKSATRMAKCYLLVKTAWGFWQWGVTAIQHTWHESGQTWIFYLNR